MKSLNLFFQAALTLTLAAGLSACGMDTEDSNTIAPTMNQNGQMSNNIDRNYSITFSEADGQSSFVSTFTKSGTWLSTVRLVPPARLTVNGVALSDSQLMSREGAVTAGVLLPALSPFFFLASGTHYYTRLAGGIGQVHEMNWTDQTGRTFTDRLQLPPARVQAPATAFRQSGFTVQMYFSGGNGETSSSVRIEQRAADGRLVMASASSNGGVVTIAPVELAKLSPGAATLHAEAGQRQRLNSAGSGDATATLTYKFRPMGLVIH